MADASTFNSNDRAIERGDQTSYLKDLAHEVFVDFQPV